MFEVKMRNLKKMFEVKITGRKVPTYSWYLADPKSEGRLAKPK